MSYAWEVTPEDIFRVLEAHEMAETVDDELVQDGLATVQELTGRITEAVMEYGADVDGISELVALREIEDILIEDGLLSEPRRFELG